MSRHDLKQASITELVHSYETAATQHAKAIDAADSRAANKAHGRLAAAYRELRARSAQDHLLPLLQSSNMNVRLWAAAHALEFAPERGEPVLLELETGSGRTRLEAEYTLIEWKKGTLKFS